jgi:Transcriptional regulator of aromatic amino acids metabolism
MQTVCTFCGRVVRAGRTPDEPVSHGVCTECHDRILTEYGFDTRKFLDQLDSPVLLVDGKTRVLAANTPALQLMGKRALAVKGTLCGDALACINAAKPKGCGQTDACPDCGFRESVMETFTTGRPVNRRAAVLIRQHGDTITDIPFVVSTRKDGDVVMLRIAPVKSGTPSPAHAGK